MGQADGARFASGHPFPNAFDPGDDHSTILPAQIRNRPRVFALPLRGVSDLLRRPLARLAEDDLAFINALVERTLDKAAIKQAVLERFMPKRSAADKENAQC